LNINLPILISELVRGITKPNETAKAFSLVLKNGYSVLGPEDAVFEQKFAIFLNVDRVLGVALVTNTLEIALKVAFLQLRTMPSEVVALY
jgi:dTDP-4-amino-4,6-dideoxygalactose transaminase